MNHLLHTRNYNFIAEYMMTNNNSRVSFIKKMWRMIQARSLPSNLKHFQNC